MSARLAPPCCTAPKRMLPIALAALACVAGCAQPAPKVTGANANAPTAAAADPDGVCASAAPVLWSQSPDCPENTTEGQLALVPVTSGFQGVSADGYHLVDASWLVDMQPEGMTGQQGVLILDAMQAH